MGLSAEPGKLHGELRKFRYQIGRSTVRDILKRKRVPPAPERARKGSNWRQFFGHYGEQVLACDFLTVETIRLRTLYGLFFIELGTRLVHYPGGTRWFYGSSNSRMGNPASAAIDLETTGKGERAEANALSDP